MDSDKKNLPGLFQHSFLDMVKSLDSLFDESIKHFDQFFSHPFSVVCYETGADMVIEAKLLNCKKDQIQINMLRNGQVKISVEHETSTTAGNSENVIFLKNQSVQKFERIVTLPHSPEAEKAKATFKDGLLRIIIPKGKQTETIIEID
ncbi:Hsp20/alpha crystallin family protein [Domibacillus iocasae]|uniref:SHSP domain-containing protein n=1 Tax=Domibacillus iocasae TaxID=1714016 RepID=A0A1E7DUM4_9BACI|nr:Hsp20/alpha crystallin family protein [Domibacillus iocasae]OES46719.1 hypothetical protein BA724_01270 [Domibacillus iocasae]